MNVTLPNGAVIQGVPEGTPKDVIAQKAISAGLATAEDFGISPPQQERPLAGQVISSETPATPEEIRSELQVRSLEAPVKEPEGRLEAFTSSFGKGVKELTGGAAQRITEGILASNESAKTDLIRKINAGQIEPTDDVLEEIDKLSLRSERLRNLIATGQGQIEALREESRPSSEKFPVTSFVGEALGQTVTGGAGALTAGGPAALTAIPESVLGRVAAGAAGGALSGGLQPTNEEESAINNALIGAGFGAGLSGIAEAALPFVKRFINARGGKLEAPDIEEMIKQADSEGIDIFIPDVSRKGMVKQAGSIAESLPFGPVKQRIAQNEQQRAAANRLAQEFGDDFDDLASTAQAGLKNQLDKFRSVSGELFDKASGILNTKGDVPTSSFDSAISSAIEKEKARGTIGNQDLINKLQGFLDAPRGNFDKIRDIRQVLGSEISGYYKGANATIGENGAQVLQQVKNSLEDDLANFAEKSGGNEGLEAFRRANKYYQDNVIPFKKSRLSALVKADDPEQIFRYLTQFSQEGGSKARARQLFNSLDDDGKEAVRGALVRKALEKAGDDPNRPFSSAKFASELGKVSNITGVFFNKKDKKRIDGLQKIFEYTQRAGQVAENPPTGSRLLIPLAVSAGTAGGAVAFSSAANLLYKSKRGRDLLLAASTSTPGSKGFQNIMKRVNDFLVKGISTSQDKQLRAEDIATPASL